MGKSISIPLNDAAHLRAWLSAEGQMISAQLEMPRLYVLLDDDPADPQSLAWLQGLVQHGAPVIRFSRDDGGGVDAAGPLFAEVEKGPSVLSQLAERALTRGGLHFLLSFAGADEVVRHLRFLRNLALTDGAALVFPYEKVQAVAALMPSLEPMQRSAFMGPVEKWAVVDACSVLHSLVAAPKRVTAWALRLNGVQMAVLEESLFPGVVMAQSHAADPDLLAGFTPCAAFSLIRQRIAQARAWGLVRRKDIALYCILSLQQPEGFESTAPYKQALEAARDWGQPLADLLPSLAPQC